MFVSYIRQKENDEYRSYRHIDGSLTNVARHLNNEVAVSN